MREYILKKTLNSKRHFRFGKIDVHIDDPLVNDISLEKILKIVEDKIPSTFYSGLEAVRVGSYSEFEERKVKVNALYKDRTLYISNEQDSAQDLLDDVVHEIAHHLETKAPEKIYEDRLLIREFLKKRKELEFELRSEGYWTQGYNFENLKYDETFDNLLYKRVGKNLLAMITAGMFIRPYASVSLREYFATGFEAYYLGKRDELYTISPELYKKITDLEKTAT